MSQTLHIGKAQENFYDCVLTDTMNIKEKLMKEWVSYYEGSYLGPWKICIVDINLWKKVENTISVIFEQLGQSYPECIWCFYYKERFIEHPTAVELSNWLKEGDLK